MTVLPATTKSSSFFLNAANFFIGAALILIGATVMIGWHSGSETIVRMLPGYAPMTYNTALAFLLCGISFTFLSLNQIVSRIASSLLILVVFLTLIEYAFGINLGIDELFVKAFAVFENAYPGRMAPLTAVCLLLAGIGLTLRRASDSGKTTLLLLGVTGSSVSAFGALSVIGFLLGSQTVYGWGQLTLMALHTAIGIVFTGCGLLALAWCEAKRKNLYSQYFIPAIVLVLSLFVTFALWQALYIQEKRSIDQTVQFEANNLKVQLEMELNTRILTLEQMANRWANHPEGTPKSEWLADARRYIIDYDSYQAIEWADPSMVIRWAEPEVGNEAAINLNLKTYTDRRAALESARNNRVTVLTRKHTLSQGGSGVIVYVPIFRDDEFGGYIIGVFRTGDLFRSILPLKFPTDYSVEFTDDDATILLIGETPSRLQTQLSAERTISSHGASWKARVHPNTQTIERLHTAFDEVVLFIGLMISALLVIAVYFTQETRRQHSEAVKANSDLHVEIDGRQRASENLRVSEQHNRDIIEKSHGFICTHTLEGIIISINPAAASALGFSPEEMIGNSISDFLSQNSVKLFKYYIERIQTELEHSGVFKLNSKTGELRIWEYQNTRYKMQTGEPYILAHAVDVTDRNKIETEMTNARNAALESVRIKAEFLANMSHEIRTPLNGILGMSNLLIDTPLDQTQRQFLETINASGESLLQIINDILDFSKLEAGKLRFDNIDFNLRNTVENTVEVFAKQTGAKNLELASLVNSDVEVALNGDPGRLRQVLTNLIGNAIKFTEYGEIVIRVEKIAETKQNTTLKFSVTDTGIGIDKDAQNLLFLAFTQADGSITRQFGGTGLGLAISKQLVELMSGDINVESVLGKGSTFYFTAEFRKQETTELAPAKSEADSSKLRVLVVDDNRTNRKILRHQIESWNMTIDEANSAAEAIEKLADKVKANLPYDLVILDLLMPVTDGFQLAREIRKDIRLSDVKIILMPSFGRRGHGRKAQNIQIDGYLTKPIRQADLHDCILAVTSGNKSTFTDSLPAPKKLITRHTIKEDRILNKELILLVEDNAVNQKLIQIQLSKLGYRTDIAGDGIQALSAIENRSYDLVLMDCQMPQMDGYAATEEIRRMETGGKRLPIIAITANVMRDEVEKCFASGMDSCLAKPFSQQQLQSELEKWLKTPAAETTDVDSPIPTITAIEIEESIESRMSELGAELGFEIVEEIISLFIEDSAKRIEQLKHATQIGDFEQIKIEAHGLKGSCGNVGAIYFAELFLKIELATKELDHDAILMLINELKEKYPELISSVKKVRANAITHNFDSTVENSTLNLAH